MRSVYRVLHFIFDVVSILILLYFYKLWIKYGLDFMQIDVWFVRVTLGIIGMSVCTFFTRRIFQFILYLFKCCDIYFIVNKDSKGVTASSILSRFKKSVSVSVVTKVVNVVGNEIIDVVKCTDAPSKLNQFVTKEDCPLLFSLAKMGTIFFNKLLLFVDELIIAYCYKHADKDVKECILDGTCIFVQNVGKLSTKLLTISVLEITIRIIYYAIAVIAGIRFIDFNVDGIIFFIICVYSFSFVIEDALIEPMIIENLVGVFLEYDDENVNEDVKLNP